MANLNKVMLIGNLTRDPEFKSTPRGQSVADFSLAINRYYTLESGEKREETTFVEVTLWGRQAEIARDYLAKGKPVYIEGRLQLDTWDDKTTGQKRSKLKVIGDAMQLLGSRGGEGGEGGGSHGGGGRGNASSSGGGGGPADEYDQRPAPRQSAQSAGGYSKPQGGGGGGGKPRPAPAQPDPDEEDDIPF